MLKSFTWREIIKAIIVVVVIIGIIMTLFRKENIKNVITGVFEKELDDTIEAVYYYRDDNGPGIATWIKGVDTPYCFNGKNYELNIFYFEYAKEGDVIVKEKSSNVFYVKRDSSLVSFELFECKQ